METKDGKLIEEVRLFAESDRRFFSCLSFWLLVGMTLLLWRGFPDDGQLCLPMNTDRTSRYTISSIICAKFGI